MTLQQFYGQTVIDTETKTRYTLTQATAAAISVASIQLNSAGCHSHFRYSCLNGDPFTRGVLVFADTSLNEPFLKCFADHCRTEEGRWEEISAWYRLG